MGKIDNFVVLLWSIQGLAIGHGPYGREPREKIQIHPMSMDTWPWQHNIMVSRFSNGNLHKYSIMNNIAKFNLYDNSCFYLCCSPHLQSMSHLFLSTKKRKNTIPRDNLMLLCCLHCNLTNCTIDFPPFSTLISDQVIWIFY